MSSRDHSKSKNRSLSRRLRRYMLLLSLLALSVIARLALPHLMLHAIRQKLATHAQFSGYIGDVDVELYRGGYTLKDLRLWKTGPGHNAGILFIQQAQLGIEWKAFFKGTLAARVLLDSVTVHISANDSSYLQEAQHYSTLLKELLPLRLNRIELRRGDLNYRHLSPTQPFLLSLQQLRLSGLNLVNGYDSTAMLPATLFVAFRAGQGHGSFHFKGNPEAQPAIFNISLSLLNMDRRWAQQLLKQSPACHLSPHSYGFYSVATVHRGGFEGEVKPVFNYTATVPWPETEKLSGSLSHEQANSLEALLNVLPALTTKGFCMKESGKQEVQQKPAQVKKKKKRFFKKLFHKG